MVWSHGVGKDGEVVGLELSEEYAGLAGKAFKDNGVENVDIKLGDAVESYAQPPSPTPFAQIPTQDMLTDNPRQPRLPRAIRAL